MALSACSPPVRFNALFVVVVLVVMGKALLALETVEASTIQVKTSDGVVTGSRNGSCVGAFYGIPYATPPVGQMRFRPPVRAEPWWGRVSSTRTAAERFQNSHVANSPRHSMLLLTTSLSVCNSRMADPTTLASCWSGQRPLPKAGHAGTCQKTACESLLLPVGSREESVPLVVCPFRSQAHNLKHPQP